MLVVRMALSYVFFAVPILKKQGLRPRNPAINYSLAPTAGGTSISAERYVTDPTYGTQ